MLSLLAARGARIQYPRCGVSIRATPTQLLHGQRQPNMRSIHGESNRHFRGHDSLVIARTPCGPRKGGCQVAEQLFGMLTIIVCVQSKSSAPQSVRTATVYTFICLI